MGKLSGRSPEVNAGPVDAGLCRGGADGFSCDEGLERLPLNGSQCVEESRIGQGRFPDSRVAFPGKYFGRGLGLSVNSARCEGGSGMLMAVSGRGQGP